MSKLAFAPPQASASGISPRSRIRKGPSPASAKQLFLGCAGLAAVTLGLYSRVGAFPFIDYDDQQYVVTNTHVTGGLNWEALRWAATATEHANWHPLTWISHALDCQLYGLNAGGHHWTNVAIHVLNVVLLFLLLQCATGALWRSAVVAGLFAIHPLNVESVAWIAERKNVLSTLFFLLALGAYGWYARKPDFRRYITVALLFVLGLASKPMVVTLPFVLMLVDVWPLQRVRGWSNGSSTLSVPQETFLRLLWEKLPLFALSAASAVITVVAQGRSVIPVAALPFLVRVEDAIYAYGVYLMKAVWPANLALIYPHPGRMLPLWQVALAALTLSAVSTFAWRKRLSRPYVLVGWLWFLGTAVPIIGIVQVGVQVVADRYAYVPLMGVFLIFAWGAADLLNGWGVSIYARMAAGVLGGSLLWTVCWVQLGHWKSTADLWTHALEVTQNNSVAERNLANELFVLNNHPEGIRHLRNYARLEPLDPAAHATLAADFLDHSQLQQAIEEFGSAIRAHEALVKSGFSGLDPETLAITYANLALTYFLLGDEGKARDNASKAMAADALAVDRLTSQLSENLTRHPAAAGYLRLGLLLCVSGHVADAQQAFVRARQLDSRIALPSIAGQFQ